MLFVSPKINKPALKLMLAFFGCKLSTEFIVTSKITIYTQYHNGVIEIYVPEGKPLRDSVSAKKIKLYKTVKRLRFAWMIRFTKETTKMDILVIQIKRKAKIGMSRFTTRHKSSCFFHAGPKGTKASLDCRL